MPFTPSPALLTKFRQSAEQRLERIENALLVLAQAADDAEQQELVRRELHTLKGESGMLGFRGAFEVTRALEELLAAAYAQQPPAPQHAARLRTGCQLVRGLLTDPPGPAGEEAARFVSDTRAALDG